MLACAAGDGRGDDGRRRPDHQDDGHEDHRPEADPRVRRRDQRAAITILAASHLGLPVSTTHVISGAIMGVGPSQRVSAVRWGVTARILWAWVLTIPISAAIAWVCYLALRLAIGD